MSRRANREIVGFLKWIYLNKREYISLILQPFNRLNFTQFNWSVFSKLIGFWMMFLTLMKDANCSIIGRYLIFKVTKSLIFIKATTSTTTTSRTTTATKISNGKLVK